MFIYITICHINVGVGHTNLHKRYTNDCVHKATDFLFNVGWGDVPYTQMPNYTRGCRSHSTTFYSNFGCQRFAFHTRLRIHLIPMSDVRVFPIKTGKIDIFICPRRDTSRN